MIGPRPQEELTRDERMILERHQKIARHEKQIISRRKLEEAKNLIFALLQSWVTQLSLPTVAQAHFTKRDYSESSYQLNLHSEGFFSLSIRLSEQGGCYWQLLNSQGNILKEQHLGWENQSEVTQRLNNEIVPLIQGILHSEETR